MEFKDYHFEPEDVIEGLNKYYASVDRGWTPIAFTVHWKFGKIISWGKRDIKDAINWLREEHNIFYTPGMKLEDPVDLDIFDNPRYKFLSILSAELGFLTIVGPCNADKTEEGILKAVKRLKEEAEEATSFKTDYANAKVARAELAYLYKKILCAPELPRDLSPHEVAVRISDKVKRISEVFEAECKRHNETVNKSVGFRIHLWQIYENVTGKAVLSDTSPEDICNEVTEVVNKLRHDRGKYKGMLNAAYGVHSVDRSPSSIGVLSDGTLINREDFADLFGLAELRAKVREIYREFHGCWKIGYSHVAALNDVLEDYKKLSKDLEHMNEQYSNAIEQCHESQSKRSDFIRELFGLLGLNHMKVPAIYTAEEMAITKAIEKLKEGNNSDELDTLKKDIQQLYRDVMLSAPDDSDSYKKLITDIRDEHRRVWGHRKDSADLQKQYDEMIVGYNKLMAYKIQLEKELRKEQLKHGDTDRKRKAWIERYESEHKRANGEHRRAEKCFNDIAALKTQVSHLMRERDAMANEEVGLQSMKNAVRKLQNEKNKVIAALGQDIWDGCVK